MTTLVFNNFSTSAFASFRGNAMHGRRCRGGRYRGGGLSCVGPARLVCLVTLLAGCGSGLVLTTAQAPERHHQQHPRAMPPSSSSSSSSADCWDSAAAAAAYHGDEIAASSDVGDSGGGQPYLQSQEQHLYHHHERQPHCHWKLVDSQVMPISSPSSTSVTSPPSAVAGNVSSSPAGSGVPSNAEAAAIKGLVDDADDQVMSILSRPRFFSDTGEWSVLATEDAAEAVAAAAAAAASLNGGGGSGTSAIDEEPVSCRPFANTTQYDHLRGIAARISLPNQPEPQVFSIFILPGKPRPSEREVARGVSERLRASPKSAHALNQAGNLLRYHGRTLGAVECFRKALSVSPNNADVLLNLGRVLFNHRYLDDATYLARRSLETQPANRNAWLQHFTLGEILRASGHTAEAAHHLRQAVSLKPEFKPAQAQLRLLEPVGQSSLTVYTLTIIAFLVLCVLAGLLTTTEANLDAYGEVMKTQRHFNRAMAMRTLRMSINPKLARSRSPPSVAAAAAAAAAAATATSSVASGALPTGGGSGGSAELLGPVSAGGKDSNNN